MMPNNHPSYEQVMLDVNRCARLERLRKMYLLRRDDEDDEDGDDDGTADERPAEDLSREIELQRIYQETGKSLDDLASVNSENDTQADNEDEDSSSSSIVDDDLPDQRRLKAKLANLIINLLIKKQDLHYYQGFHDVCLTYMNILGDKRAFKRLDHLIDTHFKTFMQPSMNETQNFLNLIPVIIGLHDKEVQVFLERAEVGTIFALSWVITWFSHVIQDENDVERIFNFLEGEDPHMVLYLSAAIVIYKRDELLKLDAEMSTVHHYLCQIPRKEKLPLDRLIKQALDSFNRWRPDYVKKKLQHAINIYWFMKNDLDLTASRLASSPRGNTETPPMKINPQVTTIKTAASSLDEFHLGTPTSSLDGYEFLSDFLIIQRAPGR